MCFQSLTKFGQAVCDMGGIIVLNIEERGWRFNTGPQHTICDEIVGRSLRNPDLLVKSKGRCGTVVVPRSVLSFESAGRSDSAAGVVLGAAGLGSDAPMAVRRCCFASSSSARSLVGVEVILHHLRSVSVLHRIRCKEPLRPSLPALRRLTIGGKLPPCSPWIGLWWRLLGRVLVDIKRTQAVGQGLAGVFCGKIERLGTRPAGNSSSSRSGELSTLSLSAVVSSGRWMGACRCAARDCLFVKTSRFSFCGTEDDWVELASQEVVELVSPRLNFESA